MQDLATAIKKNLHRGAKYQGYLLMNKGTKNKVVPKLRFPEFKNSGDWDEKILGDLTYPVSEKNKEGKRYPIYSINNVEGFLPQSDQLLKV